MCGEAEDDRDCPVMGGGGGFYLVVFSLRLSSNVPRPSIALALRSVYHVLIPNPVVPVLMEMGV